MQKSIYSSLFLTLTLIHAGLTQPGIEFIHCYGAAGTEAFSDIYATSDSAYIMAGKKAPLNGDQESEDSYVVKVDSEGQVIWEQTYGSENVSDNARTIIEADNGDFLVGGFSNNEACLFRIDSDGELQWFETYGGQRFEAVIELKEGDFVATGVVSGGSWPALLVRIDADGEVVWRREYEFLNGQNVLRALRETDEGVIVTGYSSARIPLVAYKMVTQKVDLNGNTVWTHLYPLGGNSGEFGFTMCSIPGGFIVSGRSDQRNGHLLLDRKINGNGDEIWSDNYNLDFGTEMTWYGTARLSNDDIILAGSAGSAGGTDRPIAKVISSDGAERWSSVYDMHEIGDFGAGNNSFTAVVKSPDGGVIACGKVVNEPQGTGYDGFIMKLEPLRLDPMIIVHIPNDTTLTQLTGDTVTFMVLANDQRGLDLAYCWIYNDEDTVSFDSSATIIFDQSGEQIVKCTVSNAEFSSSITWHITVTYLYISAFTPDTLNLTLRRGASVDFSLDTVRYVGDEEPEYLWTKANLNNGEQEETGGDAGATIDFPWSGDFTVEGRVSRGESSDSVLWNVAVRGAIWAYVPEALAFDVEPESVVHFEVVPSEPENESLSIQWWVDGEVVEEDTVALEWDFSRADLNPPYLTQVSVVVADSVEADTVTWDVTVRDLGVEGGGIGIPPYAFGLLSVSPNPFNSMLTIRYSVGAQGLAPLRLAIYDLSGREVADLSGWFGNRPYAAGEKITPPTPPAIAGRDRRTVTWNASSVPAGVYLVRLQSGTQISTRKVVLIR